MTRGKRTICKFNVIPEKRDDETRIQATRMLRRKNQLELVADLVMGISHSAGFIFSISNPGVITEHYVSSKLSSELHESQYRRKHSAHVLKALQLFLQLMRLITTLMAVRLQIAQKL